MLRKVSLTIVCLFVVPMLYAQTPEQKKATIKFLQELQVADGGFIPAPVDGRLDTNPKGSLRATSSALRALKYFGGTPNDKEAAAKFVKSCYDKGAGAFSDSPGGKGDVFTTSIGLMAAAELKLQIGDYAKAAQYLCEKAKEFEDVRIAAAGLESYRAGGGPDISLPVTWAGEIAKGRNPDGSFGKGAERARITGSKVVTLLRVGDRIDTPDAILKILNDSQNKDGAFGKDDTGASDLETTYRIMRCYHMLKAKPAQAGALMEFGAKCRNADGGYGVQPGKPSNVGGAYFAGIILHWLSEP